jgi:hypothetical protein
MKNLLLLIVLAVFTANVSAETYQVKSSYELNDGKPKKKKHKKSHKAKRHAKKKGLVGRGCRGFDAMPGRR